MPVKVYDDNFNETLHSSVIGKAINQTGEVATQFWLKHFERKCKHQNTQTLTMDQILSEYTT